MHQSARARRLLSSAALLAMSCATSWAQSPAESGQAEITTPDIVVTARRRSELLQNVPVAITAFSQADLDHKGLNSLTDIGRASPGMAVSPSTGDPLQGAVTIRGQGGLKQGSGPAVVNYNNEVPIVDNSKSRSILAANFFFDLENLQVLKGPQGTLFGRNSTGGALLLVTRKPSDSFSGYVKIGGGSFGTRTAEGAVDLPLSGDRILLRIAGAYQEQDGYAKSLGQPGRTHPFRLNDSNYIAGRATLIVRPTDTIENQLTVQASKLWTNGYAKILTYLDPDGAVATAFGPFGINAIYAQQQALGRYTQVPTTDLGKYNRYYFSAINTFSWKVTDSVTFRSISSYQSLKTPSEPPDQDYDGTIFPIIGGCCVAVSNLVKQYTQEVQLQGQSFDDRLDWSVGAFYLNSPFQRPTRYIFRAFGTDISNVEAFKERSVAVYAQGTYRIVDGLSLTLGLRNSWDKRGARSNNAVNSGPILSTQGSFKKLTWTTGLSYQVTPSTLLFFNSRRGYRSGGLNPTVPNPDLVRFGPETVTDYELGAKTSWSIGNVRAVTNIAAYRQDYKDVQQSVSLFIGGLQYGYIVNAGKAKVKGLELEQSFALGDFLTLSGTLAYLDYKTTRFAPGVDPNVLLPVAAPKWTYTLGGDVKLLDEPAIGTLRARADWSWTDRRNDIFIAGSQGNVIETQGPVGLLNIGATLDRVAGAPVDLSVLVKNVTDKRYSLGGFAFAAGGFNSNVFSEPRSVMVNLTYRFGPAR